MNFYVERQNKLIAELLSQLDELLAEADSLLAPPEAERK